MSGCPECGGDGIVSCKLHAELQRMTHRKMSKGEQRVVDASRTTAERNRVWAAQQAAEELANADVIARRRRLKLLGF